MLLIDSSIPEKLFTFCALPDSSDVDLLREFGDTSGQYLDGAFLPHLISDGAVEKTFAGLSSESPVIQFSNSPHVVLHIIDKVVPEKDRQDKDVTLIG